MMRHHWKKIIVAFSVIGWVALAGQAVAAESWAQVADRIETEQQQSINEAVATEKIIEKDRAALLRDLKDLNAQEKQETRALDKLKARFEALLEDEAKLTADLESEQDEIDAVEGTIRGAAKEASSMSRDNIITPEFPERTEAIDALLRSRRFPGLEGIETLTEIFFQEMAAGGEIKRRTGDFVGPDGRNATGEILRVGRFTVYYRLPDGSAGFLQPEASGDRLIAVAGEVPRSMQNAIKDYFDNESSIAPIDPSGAGAAFAQLKSGEDLRDKFEKGGMLMWPILMVGIVAIILGLERMGVLLMMGTASDKIMDKIKEMATQGMYKEAREYCSTKTRIPTCVMLDRVMENVGDTQEVLENALQEAMLKQAPRLQRFLPTLAVLAAIAPLLGLLGTVTGMINTFQVITMVGTGDPRMMSGGISEALLTTQFGLMVAIPIMLLHHFLERLVEKIQGDMETKGIGFAVTLLKSDRAAEA